MNNVLRMLFVIAFLSLSSNCNTEYDKSRDSVAYFMNQWIQGAIDAASDCYAAPSQSIKEARFEALLESVEAIGDPKSFQFIDVKSIMANESDGGHVVDVQIIVLHARGRSLQTFRVYLPSVNEAGNTPCVFTDHTVNLEKKQ